MAAARRILEVAVATPADAEAAEAHGADRIELNAALELGGLTPSLGCLEETVAAVTVPVISLVRPRPAGFVYSAAERRMILRDVEHQLAGGAAGIACGALQSVHAIDREFCRDLLRVAAGAEVVFHRAFDLLIDQLGAASELAALGFARILTSGGAPSARQGVERLDQLARAVGSRIEILPAAGIRPEQIPELLGLSGCQAVHGTFRQPAHDPAGPVAEPVYWRTDPRQVAEARRALDDLSQRPWHAPAAT